MAVSVQLSAVGLVVAPSLQITRIGRLNDAQCFVLGASGNCLPATITEGESDVRGGDARPLDDALIASEGVHSLHQRGRRRRARQGRRVFDRLDETLAAIR